MKTQRFIIVLAAPLLFLAGCAQDNSLFHWGSYEQTLYSYSKKPEARAQYKEALEKAIERGEETNKVAPGLYAELGYLYLEDGEFDTAQAKFAREMELFPESRHFLTSIMARASGDDATPEAAQESDEAQSTETGV